MNHDMNNEATASVTPEEQPSPPLIVNALYTRHHMTYIATSSSELELIGDPDRRKFQNDKTDEFNFHSAPGSEAWVTRMVEFRDASVRSTRTTNTMNAQQVADLESKIRFLTDRHEGLGQALLQEATERDWCYEYDEFAEDWDLPRRTREYEVTMTIVIKATSDDEAETLVAENVGLSSWDDVVVSGPSFDSAEY